MNWLVMKLVFMTIPTQPMPFFVKPIARKICNTVLVRLIDPNVDTAMEFMEDHLAKHKWFAGDRLTLADFQMSFALEAALSRVKNVDRYTHMMAYRQRINDRPAYQRAIAKGGEWVARSWVTDLPTGQAYGNPVLLAGESVIHHSPSWCLRRVMFTDKRP